MFCRKCGNQIPNDSERCLKCDQVFIDSVPTSFVQPPPLPTNPNKLEKAPKTGIVMGLLIGCVGGAIIFALGGLLSITGIGVIIGGPMMIAGALAPVSFPVIGYFYACKGVCPYCQAPLFTISFFTSSKCSACKQTIIIHDNVAEKLSLN